MVIFHSYVKLPEGKPNGNTPADHQRVKPCKTNAMTVEQSHDTLVKCGSVHFGIPHGLSLPSGRGTLYVRDQ